MNQCLLLSFTFSVYISWLRKLLKPSLKVIEKSILYLFRTFYAFRFICLSIRYRNNFSSIQKIECQLILCDISLSKVEKEKKVSKSNNFHFLSGFFFQSMLIMNILAIKIPIHFIGYAIDWMNPVCIFSLLWTI